MRADRFFLIISILALFVLAACAPTEEPRVETWDVCGNGICSTSEEGTCDADCIVEEAVPTPDETLAWIEKVKAERLNSTPGKYEPVTPDPNVPQINPATVPVETALPEIGFSVASRNNFLSVNENISSVAGHFSGLHMRQVLGGGSLSSNTEAFGPRFASYEQFLTLRSGKVSFGYDEDKEVISSYLEYRQDDPIIEYYWRLNSGVIKFFEGQTINFLGHTYVLDQVTNNSILLLGTDGQNEILLRHAHSSFVNNQEISPDVHVVNVTKDSFKIIVRASDNFKILPGESLTEYVSRRMLLTNRVDVTYEGLSEVPSIDLHLRKSGQNYRLSFQNNLGMNYTLPLTTINPFGIGNENGRFIFTESRSNTDFSIKEGDYFIINNARETGGITTLLRLKNVDYDESLIKFEDPALESFYVYFDGNATQGNANGDLLVYGVNHKVYVSPNSSVAIDMNGDRIVNGASITAVAAGNTLLKFENTTNNLTIRYIIPGNLRENSRTDLETRIVIDSSGITIPQNSLNLSRDRELDHLVGMTDYGTLFVLTRNTNRNAQRGTELIINQPLVQRLAEVIVKAYE